MPEQNVQTRSKTTRPSATTGMHRTSRKQFILQLVIVLLAWMCLIGLHWDNNGLWFQGDSPRHAANGLFWKEFLFSGSLDPQDFALRYYARYPVISPTNYPPFFYLLEGAAFMAFHPSSYIAKGLVQVFALLAACYLMFWLRRWVAAEAGWIAAILLLTPGFVLWSNAVMLNLPAAAVSLAALYHARRWIEASAELEAKRHLYLTAALSGLAILTYFLAAILIFVILAWILLLQRWVLLRQRRTIVVALAAAVPLLPFIYVSFEWAPTYVSFVADGFEAGFAAADWSFYLKALPKLAGPYLPALSALGLVIGIVCRRWRRECLLLLIFLLIYYMILSLITARDSRYGLLFCVPIVCFCAMAIQFFAEMLSKWLRYRERLSITAVLVIVLIVFGAQARIAATTRVPRVQGFRDAVTFIERVAPDEPVFYDGYYHNVFTFYVQAGDPEYKRGVILGSKLLYASAINPMGYRYESYVNSPTQVVQALQTRSGCRWLAIEISEQSKLIPAANMLRDTLRGPQFEFVRFFPVSGRGLDGIEIYRSKINPRPIDELDIPFPILGEGIRYKIRPIQR